MKLVFMGTPALAVPALELVAIAHPVVAVVTQPDRPAGRGGHLTAPPVKLWAQAREIPVLQPERARDELLLEELRVLAADAIVVVAYGQILPQALLDLPPQGCINLHYSLLPRWRGAAPVQHAILHGDPVTGVTTQWMARQLDAGDVIVQRTVPIESEETSGELLRRLSGIGAATLAETLALVEQGRAPRHPQDPVGVTLAPTLKKENARVDWHLAASAIARAVRAYDPWPVAWLPWRDGELKLWRATAVGGTGSAAAGAVVAVGHDHLDVQTGEGLLRVAQVQQSGRARMDAGAWARGVRLQTGYQFE